jgi:2-oxoglutarate ferredoxin oxidoreductase subunit alpha
VLTAAELEAGRDFGRYLEVEDDGIAYRTLPGTHPNKGAFFTRGTSRTRYARYSEEGFDYVDNMQRLLKKFETAKGLVPAPVEKKSERPTRYGVIYFGSTTPSMHEALEGLAAEGIISTCFASAHFRSPTRGRFRPGARSRVRRRAKPRCAAACPARQRVRARSGAAHQDLHYDGTPVTARFIRNAIAEEWHSLAGIAGKDAAE